MMKHLFLSFFLLLTFDSYSQQAEQRNLWPDAPTASEAEIFIYHPKQSPTPVPAVLICPGGGYARLAIDHEGHNMAKWYVSKGFVAVVLKYRMPKGDHTVPLSDAEKAMSIIRENAKEWNIDSKRVGVVGSSAGGHLAASLSTLAADANRPNFAVLYYPVTGFDLQSSHSGSKKNLLGNDLENPLLIERYSLYKQVDAKTPATLLLLSDDDKIVAPANSLLYYTALQEQHISAAMHIFPEGDHGWGFLTSFPYHEEVKNIIEKWLRHIHIIN